uniref:MATE family efflux transporter n=1 Tax=Agathobacter sp. TaxID=2021311 RepID=UPI0040564976
MYKWLEKHLDKEMLAALVTLAWPTILEQLLSTIVQYIDTAMVGRLGAEATATISLSSTYTWLINSIMSAAGVGFLAYIARAIGEKNEYKIRHAAGQAAMVALVVGSILTGVTLAAAPYMPVWMGAEEAIHREASIYFALINLPLVFRAAILIFGAVLRSTGDTKTPMYINVLVNVCNMAFNYVFIYALGFGAIGAGIATAISFMIGGVLMAVAFVRNKTIAFKADYAKPEWEILRGVLKIGIPVMMTSIVSCSGYVVATSFVSSMATTIYAAHSIAITAETIFYIPGYGIQAATATLVGNALGENDEKKQRDVSLISIGIIFMVMVVTGVLLFFSAEWMMRLFTKDAEVVEIGAALLRIVAFSEPIFGSAAVMEGIYNGLGRTRYPFVVELFTRWGIRILGSFICVRVLDFGIHSIWYCMIADNVVKAALLVFGLRKVLRGNGRK